MLNTYGTLWVCWSGMGGVIRDYIIPQGTGQDRTGQGRMQVRQHEMQNVRCKMHVDLRLILYHVVLYQVVCGLCPADYLGTMMVHWLTVYLVPSRGSLSR